MQLIRSQKIAIAAALLPVVVIWLVNGIYLAMLARISVTLFWLADFVQWIILPAILLWLLAKKASIFPRHYGLDTTAMRWDSLALRSLAVLCTAGLIYFASYKLSWQLLNHPSGYFTFPGVFPGGIMGTVVWLYSAATAGLIESIFFIGLPWLLYHNIRSDPSRIAFTLITSLVFALAHWEQGPHNIIAAFCFNLAACAWYFRLDTLWPLVAGHTLVDLIDFS